MARKREESFFDETFELLKIAPAWVGPAFALVLFAAFRFLIPALQSAHKSGAVDTGAVFRPIWFALAWAVAGAVLVLWVIAEVWKLFNRRLLDRQAGTDGIRDMPWQHFEQLVCEAYRRQGYLAQLTGSPSGDGGFDVRLTGPAETILVQCKHWKEYAVGVKTVRELLGAVISENATKGIVVTSGRFTRDAQAFAARNPRIELVDGPRLAELVKAVQAGPPADPPPPAGSPPTCPPCPACPRCNAPMVLRTARQGPHAGSKFWGCANYPACRGTRELPAPQVSGGAPMTSPR